MKYIRFESQLPNPGARRRAGVFQAAYALKHSDDLDAAERANLTQALGWLEMHLKVPTIYDDRGGVRALCWFEDIAREPLKRIWAMKHCLEANGYWIDVVKTDRPGLILYEDGWQVAAKPWRGRR